MGTYLLKLVGSSQKQPKEWGRRVSRAGLELGVALQRKEKRIPVLRPQPNDLERGAGQKGEHIHGDKRGWSGPYCGTPMGQMGCRQTDCSERFGGRGLQAKLLQINCRFSIRGLPEPPPPCLLKNPRKPNKPISHGTTPSKLQHTRPDAST